MNVMKDQQFLVLLDARIEEIARAVFFERVGDGPALAQPLDDVSAKLREELTFIKAKEHITVREAALLMSCSDSHIRKLVTLARKRRTGRPIPFVDLEGVTVFPLATLLEWANARPHLQVISNEAA